MNSDNKIKIGDLKFLKRDSLILSDDNEEVMASLTEKDSWVMVIKYPSIPKNLFIDSQSEYLYVKVLHPAFGFCWVAFNWLGEN
jgi:hypothetical protein